MESSVANTTQIWPFMAYTAIVIALVGLILGLSYVLGQHHKDRARGEPYESGILSTGSARLRFPSQFYMVAMLFVIFDVEAVFIITWAIAFEDLGWPGYISVCIFIFILLVVLFYEWRNGALNFGPSGKRIIKGYKNFLREAAKGSPPAAAPVQKPKTA